MTIGQRIRRRREELCLTQDELAILVGYKSRSSINKIELDVQNLKQSKIKRIADALQTTPGYIMGWETQEPNREKTDREQLIDIINGLSDEDVSLWLHIFKEKIKK